MSIFSTIISSHKQMCYKEIASGETSSLYFDENHFYRVMERDDADTIINIFVCLPEKIRQKFVQTQFFDKHFFFQKKNQSVLIHDKINYISYPHEWCAAMLKDAALFHLNLQQELLQHQVYLKDAHPWNILFNNGKFVFVDVPSLIYKKNEDWNYFCQIMDSMFCPYFFKPLCGYAYGKREWIKRRIESTTLNAATDLITLRNCLPQKRVNYANLSNMIKLTSKIIKYNYITSIKSKKSIHDALKNLYHLIESLPVKKGDSDYKSYYSQKNELMSHTYDDSWNQKQKSIHQVLLNSKIITVLDIACNTGWYSILAAKLGKKVVALDVDEACIEELYIQVKRNGFDILPLHSSISQLTKNKYSIQTGKRTLINFSERMKCDAVLALGILHHLVLGEGATFEDVFELLSDFTDSQLIVEFVDKQDEKIESEPDFFKAFFNNRLDFEFYTLENFLEISKKYFSRFQMLSSYPSTRKIIVFEK